MRKNLAKGAGIAAGLLALASLGGCDWLSPQPPRPEATGNVVEETPSSNAAEPAANVAAPADVNAAAPVEVRDAPPPPDAQTLDDADATGMTARVNRDEAPANSTTVQ
jgi:hypothetical protein